MDLDIKKLASLNLFDNIPQEDIYATIKSLNGYIQTFGDGEKLYAHNKKINHVGIILNGCVILKQIQLNGLEVVLNIFSEYKLIGSVVCFMKDLYENLEYISRGQTTILFLDVSTNSKDSIFRCQIFENLAEILAKISYQLFKRTKIISESNLRNKILLFFNTYCAEIHKNPFELPLTRNELANYLNADRSALCRELGRMQNDNLIKVDGRKITLIEKEFDE